MLTFYHWLLRSWSRIVQTWCEELIEQCCRVVHQALRRRNCWALKVIIWTWLKTLLKRIRICQMLRGWDCLLTFWLRWEKLIYCFFNAGRYSLRIKLCLGSNLCSSELLLLLNLKAFWNFIYLFDCYIRVSSWLSEVLMRNYTKVWRNSHWRLRISRTNHPRNHPLSKTFFSTFALCRGPTSW